MAYGTRQLLITNCLTTPERQVRSKCMNECAAHGDIVRRYSMSFSLLQSALAGTARPKLALPYLDMSKLLSKLEAPANDFAFLFIGDVELHKAKQYLKHPHLARPS